MKKRSNSIDCLCFINAILQACLNIDIFQSNQNGFLVTMETASSWTEKTCEQKPSLVCNIFTKFQPNP